MTEQLLTQPVTTGRTVRPAPDFPLVVLIAPTVAERVALMERVGGLGPVLVVASAEEARQVLSPAAPEPGPDDAPSTTGGLRVLEDRHAVATGTGETSLTPLEFRLLRCLLADQGRVCSFAGLSRRVWGTSHLGDASQVHAVVKRLRRKLSTVKAPLRVEAVRGIGFRAVQHRPLQAVGGVGRD